jgi:crossover junction endodeoxyribonuclease RuvC
LIILGLDPGSNKTGFGLIEKKGKSFNYIDSGVIFLCKEENFYLKLLKLKHSISALLLDFKPDCVAMESLIYVKSPTALIKLSQARGVILAMLVDQYHRHFFEYSPNLIKQVVTGHGHADKAAIQKMLQTILKLDQFASDDESDALAVALCHGMLGHSQIVQKSNSKNSTSGLAGAVKHAVRSK